MHFCNNFQFNIFLILVFIGFIFSCKQGTNNNKQDHLTVKADSLYALARIISDDSLYYEKAIETFQESYIYYKKTDNKRGMANVNKRIGFAYDYLEDYSKVKDYHKKALTQYIEIDNKKQSAIILNYLGIAYTITGDLDSALLFYNQGLEMTEITRDTLEFIEIYQNMGISYSNAGNYEKAIENSTKALKYCEELNYTKSIVSIHLHIAQDYNSMGDLDLAFKYCKKAFEYLDENESPYTLATYYNTIGELYDKKGNYKSARESFLKTLEISQDVNYKRGMAAAYSNLSGISIKEQNLLSAEKYAYRSIELESEINNISGVITSLLNIAKLQYKQKQYNKALAQLKKAKDLCTEKCLYNLLPNIYYHYYQVYKLLGKQKEALLFCENYYVLKDSLSGVEVKEKIADIEIKYQTEKKLQKIELLNLHSLNQQKQIVLQFMFIGFLIISSFFAALIFTQFRKRKLAEIEKMQNDIFEYLTQIDNISKSLSDFKSKSKNEVLVKIKEFDLSEREQEVLFLIAEGNRNKEIAEKMFISLSTVKTHTTNIFYKLDVKNRIEAIKKTKFL